MSRHRLFWPTRRPAPRGRDRSPPLSVGVGICPRCGGPMTARQGKTKPYFHCLCYERKRDTEAHG
jgi:hypothetical protein